MLAGSRTGQQKGKRFCSCRSLLLFCSRGSAHRKGSSPLSHPGRKRKKSFFRCCDWPRCWNKAFVCFLAVSFDALVAFSPCWNRIRLGWTWRGGASEWRRRYIRLSKCVYGERETLCYIDKIFFLSLCQKQLCSAQGKNSEVLRFFLFLDKSPRRFLSLFSLYIISSLSSFYYYDDDSDRA